MKNHSMGLTAFLLAAQTLMAAACTKVRDDGGAYLQARKLFLEGNFKAGLTAAESGFHRNPADLTGLCLYARLLLLNGQISEAEEVIRRALPLRADDRELLLLLARSRFEAGHPAEALQILDHAVSTALLEEVYLERAKIFIEFGEDRKAEASVRNALLLRGIE